MKVGMKDLNAISMLQFAEAFINTAIDHWWDKLKFKDDHDLLRMNERLMRIHSELHRYNNIIEKASNKSIRPDVQAKVGEFMVMIIAVIEAGFEDMNKVERMLRHVGFVTDTKMRKIKGEISEVRAENTI